MPAANSWEGVQKISSQKTCYTFVEMFIGDSASLSLTVWI